MSASYGYPPSGPPRSYSQPVYQPQPFTPPSGTQVLPGSITYTTSTGHDGRVIYHPFKAVAASYQTPSGVVTGIQWVPAEATQIVPAGAMPANAEFTESWHRGHMNDRSLKEWRHDEEKRRKKEEKEAAKHLREKEDAALRKAREKDAIAYERRKSINPGVVQPTDPGYPGYGGNQYPTYSPGGGTVDLDRRFAEMGVRDDDKRPGSHPSVYGSPYPSNVAYPTATRASTFPTTGAPYHSASRNASPNVRPTDIPRSTTPVPGATAGSGVSGFPQASIPVQTGPPFAVPGGFVQQTPPQQLLMPEAFSRPTNAALPYTPFDTLKIKNMDDLIDEMPDLPMVLQTHDVYYEDWKRFVNDLTRAWTGTLPIPELASGRSHPKRATVTADLIDMWNKSFFLARKVEVGLYKGREKRSGQDAGTIDYHLPSFETEPLSSDSSSLSSSDASDSDGDRYGQSGYGYYGRQAPSASSEERHKRKAEKKRRAKEKKLRKKAKKREKRYALYLISLPQGRAGYGPGYAPAGPVPVGPGMGGRASPMPGRASPLPGYGPNPGPGGITGRTSPMPGGFNPTIPGGRSSPVPGYNPLGGRTSPMPAPYAYAGGRASPRPF